MNTVDASPPPLIAMAWLPTKPPRPCPEILTEAEAILYLRIDTAEGSKKRTLKRYRRLGMLRGIRIGNQIHYRLEDLRAFAESKSKEAQA